jgi:uncharacterized membrane protein YccC
MSVSVSVIWLVSGCLLSAAFSAFFTVRWAKRRWRADMERQLQVLRAELELNSTREAKRVVAEALAAQGRSDVLREMSLKAARSGGDLLSEGLSSLFGRRRRVEDVDVTEA